MTNKFVVYSTADRVTYANTRFGITADTDQSIISVNWACAGTEQQLLSCSRDNLTSDCDHNRDAGVYCFDETLSLVIKST